MIEGSSRDKRALLAEKAPRTKIGMGPPNKAEGNDGDLQVRQLKDKVKLFVKYKGIWHGVNVGKSFDIVEKQSEDAIKSKDNFTNRNQVSTNKIVSDSDFTLDASGDITLDADGGEIYFKDGGTTWGALTTLSSKSTLVLYEAAGASSDDYMSISTTTAGATTIATNDNNAAIAHLTLDIDGDVILDPASGITKFYLNGDTDDLCTLTVAANGATTIATSDSDGAVGHLTLDPDGDVIVSGANVKIDATKILYLDGGVDTFIHEHGADYVRFAVGGDRLMEMSENGDDGNQVHFYDSSVGFTQLEPTYDASATDVDFRHSNKQNLTFNGGSITNINLFFPLMSGNFQLLLKQDGPGSRTITNYKVYEFDESLADGQSAVKWAGGSNPTLTTDANHVDILSFYWDADNEICYGTATLDFQF